VYIRKVSLEEMAKIIDHTNLKPYATRKDIEKLCNEALEYHFGAVCVNSSYVSHCYKLLNGSDVKIAAVVGFPLGACTSGAKASETREAVRLGAEEIDMVMNIGFFRDKDYYYVEKDIAEVVRAAEGAIVKVILETGYLTDEQIVQACEIAKKAGAHYVKTSTGFGPMGAFYDHVLLMRKTVGKELGVKAAGGISDAQTAVRMINAGADRIGASSSINIIKTLEEEIEKGTWFENRRVIEEEIYSWGAADPKKQPKDVYDYYYEKRAEFYRR